MDESVLQVLYRHWIWIGPPLVVAAVVALVALIQGTVAMVRSSLLLRVPLEEVQEVHFREVGPVALAIEGPLGTSRFAGVSFELTSVSGEPVPSRPVLLRTRSTGLARTRLELLRFDLPWSGGYRLLMTGLGTAQERDAAHAVVFTRPHRAETIAFVVGIVLASVTLVASLVFFLMRLVGVLRGP